MMLEQFCDPVIPWDTLTKLWYLHSALLENHCYEALVSSWAPQPIVETSAS